MPGDFRTVRPRPDARWHLDEVFVSTTGKRMYLWRAVDGEDEVLDILIQPRRNKKAALKLMRRLLKKKGFVPDTFITDKLPSYGAALKDLGFARRHDFGGRKNNRAEGLSLASPTAGTTHATFQIGSISATVSLYPRHRLQHLQRPTPSDFPKNVTPVSQPRNGSVANRHRCRVSLSSMPNHGTTVQQRDNTPACTGSHQRSGGGRSCAADPCDPALESSVRSITTPRRSGCLASDRRSRL